jgi:hypothetical protein
MNHAYHAQLIILDSGRAVIYIRLNALDTGLGRSGNYFSDVPKGPKS